MTEPTHIHHIIPRHVTGGVANNHPDNLIELTVLDHAIAHKVLYGFYGRWQDRIAWQMLSGQIDSAAAHWEALRLSKTGQVRPTEHRQAISRGAKKSYATKPERRKKQKQHLLKISKLSSRTKGMTWITDGDISRMIDINEQVPFGWARGRSKSAAAAAANGAIAFYQTDYGKEMAQKRIILRKSRHGS